MNKFKSRTSKLAFLAIGVLLAFALSLIFTVNNGISALAAETDSASFIDTKVYSKATVNEDFADDTILVTLNGTASKNLRDYSVDDFPELNLVGVKDLTAPTVELAKKQITAERTRNWNELQSRADAQMLLNVDEFRQILCLTLRESGKENVLKAIKTLEAREDIIAAEPNYRVQGEAVPHTTLYNAANQWGLNDASHGIRAQDAWNITTGVNTVIIGIVDSGIDSTHPDLTNRLHRGNPHNINTTLHRDYVDGTAGNNFAIVDPVGPHWHGTHVSGIVGAEWNNANSISGVAWNVRLVSLRVLDASNSGWQADIVSAVAFAGGAGIRVLNVSIGGGTYTTAQQTTLRNYPGLMICAAGNDNRNSNLTTSTDPGNPSFPGSFAFDNILTVGATARVTTVTPTIERRATKADGWTNGSNWGSTAVHVFAPGTAIRSTMPGGGYGNANGTSMAAPMVTGIAALMLSVNPNLTVAQIKSIIINNVDPVANLSGLCTSGGRVNAFKAVSAVAFTTGTATGGISIATRTGFSFPNNTNLVLPDRFAPLSNTVPTEQQNVTAIAANAFSGQTGMSQITIPGSVTGIGNLAFKGCTNLQFINLGVNSQLYRIGEYAFQNCTSLTTINIPPLLSETGRTPFSGCVGLYGFIIPGSITENQHRWINLRGSLVLGNHNYVNGVCNICGHVGTGAHIHLYDEHLPGPPGKFGHQHYSYCDCGHSKLMPCLGRMPDYPPYDVFCLFCGQYMGGGGIMYSITLPNGITYISETPITYETFYQLSKKVGVSCEYNDFTGLSKDYYLLGELPVIIRKRVGLDDYLNK